MKACPPSRSAALQPCSTASLRRGETAYSAKNRYLIPDALYGKRDAAVLSAIVIGPDERRGVLGVSSSCQKRRSPGVASSTAWLRAGCKVSNYIVFGDHQPARRSPSSAWRRHLAEVPIPSGRQRHSSRAQCCHNRAHRRRTENCLACQHAWQSSVRTRRARRGLPRHRTHSPPGWKTPLLKDSPVFILPEHHRRRLRTSNPLERAVQQEVKRRTVKSSVFPDNQVLLRLVSAVPVEIDETWGSDNKPFLSLSMGATSNGNAGMRDHARNHSILKVAQSRLGVCG